MPSDLSGTPTALGIGTYNTSIDAPSGLGFNEAMAQIDVLIAERMLAPASPASGQVPVWNGTTWVAEALPAVESIYASKPADTAITATTEATAVEIVAATFTADGTSTYTIEFYAPRVDAPAAAGAQINLWMFVDGSTGPALAELVNPAAAAFGVPVHSTFRVSPAAGSHTYSVRANVTSGTGTVHGGTGASGDWVPATLRVVKV